MRTPNWRPKWLNQERGNQPVTVERDRRGHAADVMSPEGSNLRSSCLGGRNDLPQKERHCVLRHSARRASRGHEKAMATWRQRPGPKQIQAEGPYRAQQEVGIKTSRKVC